MNNIENLQTTFTFESNQIQTLLIDGEPHFIAIDVCNILGIVNAADNVKKTLEKDEYLTYIVSRSGQNRRMYVVNESGLYALIFQSRKPNAKAFRKWVTSEVLPALRKTGKYEIPQTPKQLPNDKKNYNKQKIATFLSEDEIVLLNQACAKLEYNSIYQLLQVLVHNFLNGNEPIHEIKALKDELKQLKKEKNELLEYKTKALEKELLGYASKEFLREQLANTEKQLHRANREIGRWEYLALKCDFDYLIKVRKEHSFL